MTGIKYTMIAGLITMSSLVWANQKSNRLLVALEGGGAVQLNAKTGDILQKYEGNDAFGAIYTKDGSRAFITDKATGFLMELDTRSNKILGKTFVGSMPQQPAINSAGILFIPLAGSGEVARVQTTPSLRLIDKLSTGKETKPYIVSLSPDGNHLWVTVQGKDPKVVVFDVSSNPIKLLKEYRYSIVPRVIDAAKNGLAFFTGHHSTGMHSASLQKEIAQTIFMDVPGPHSVAAKQIEGVDSNNEGSLVGMTHEGMRSAVFIHKSARGFETSCRIKDLPNKPYWVTLDPHETIAYVSIPGAGLVQAFDIHSCRQTPLWSTQVGGKAKRMSQS